LAAILPLVQCVVILKDAMDQCRSYRPWACQLKWCLMGLLWLYCGHVCVLFGSFSQWFLVFSFLKKTLELWKQRNLQFDLFFNSLIKNSVDFKIIPLDNLKIYYKNQIFQLPIPRGHLGIVILRWIKGKSLQIWVEENALNTTFFYHSNILGSKWYFRSQSEGLITLRKEINNR